MPVNQEHHLQGDKGEAETVGYQRTGAQGNLFTGQAGPEEGRFRPLFVIIHIEGNPVLWQLRLDFENLIQIGEGGNIEEFRVGLPEFFLLKILPLQEKRFQLTEGVVYLDNHCQRLILLIVAEVEADGIEDVAEGPEVGQQGDAGRNFGHSLAGKVGLDIGAQGGVTEIEVVVIIEGVDIEAIVADEWVALNQGINFIQIQMPHEDPAGKPVGPGCGPSVENSAVK